MAQTDCLGVQLWWPALPMRPPLSHRSTKWAGEPSAHSLELTKGLANVCNPLSRSLARSNAHKAPRSLDFNSLCVQWSPLALVASVPVVAWEREQKYLARTRPARSHSNCYKTACRAKEEPVRLCLFGQAAIITGPGRWPSGRSTVVVVAAVVPLAARSRPNLAGGSAFCLWAPESASR